MKNFADFYKRMKAMILSNTLFEDCFAKTLCINFAFNSISFFYPLKE